MIPERILMKEGQNRVVQFDCHWQWIPRLKNTEPRAGTIVRNQLRKFA